MKNDSDNSKFAILKSFVANFMIGIIKLIAALFTSSGALMAEAIHSFADCGNQMLLFVGMVRSLKSPSRKNPMGFARESYFWAMLVGVLMFFLGGIFSIYTGVQHLIHPEPLENIWVAGIIIFISAILEGWALRGAMLALKKERKNKTLWAWFKDTRSSELLVLTGEDIAALTGLLVAAVALFLTWITNNPIFDAVGGIVIGLWLTLVAFVVTREIHQLIIGEAADPNIGITIKGLASDYDFHAHEIILLQHGHEVMVSIKLEPLRDCMTLSEAMESIIDLEDDIKNRMPQCKWIFCEPCNRDLGQSD